MCRSSERGRSKPWRRPGQAVLPSTPADACCWMETELFRKLTGWGLQLYRLSRLLLAEVHSLVHADDFRHSRRWTHVGRDHTKLRAIDLNGIVIGATTVAFHAEVAGRAQLIDGAIGIVEGIVHALTTDDCHQVMMNAHQVHSLGWIVISSGGTLFLRM